MWFGRLWQRVIKAGRTTFVLIDRFFTSPFFKRYQSWSSHISLIGLCTYMGGSERVGTMCVCVALQFVVTSCSLHFRFDLLSRLRFSATSASFKLRSSSLRWKMESQYQSVCFSPPSPPLQVRIARRRHLNFVPTSLLHSHVNLVPTLGLYFDATMDPFKWRLCRSLHMFPNQKMKRPLNPAAKRGPGVGWKIENAKPRIQAARRTQNLRYGLECAGNLRIS